MFLIISDVFTLLKSSNKIFDEFEKSEDDLYLIIKPWYKINLKMEFRLFITNSTLKCICQRNINYYFDYTDEEKTQIKKQLH